MSIVLMFIFTILLNVVVIRVSKDEKKRMIISGLLVMFLITPIVIAVTGISIGIYIGDGIGGGAAGFTFGLITLINGLIILIIGIKKESLGFHN
ncbi:MAG: hypothetical protein ACQEUT_14405 [Bacillota bacterium]